MHFSRFKIWVIMITCLAGIIFCIPNFLGDTQFKSLPAFLQKRVNLGLELRGGSYLQMQVDLESSYRDTLHMVQIDLRKKLRKEGIKFSELAVKDSTLEVTLVHKDDEAKLRNIIRTIEPDLSIETTQDNLIKVFFNNATRKLRDTAIISQCIEVVRRRVDETGTKEPYICRQGQDRIILQLPGIDDPSAVKALVGQTGRLTFRLIKGFVTKDQKSKSLPQNTELMQAQEIEGGHYIVDKEVLLTGDVLQNVRVGRHEGQYVVEFTMNAVGARKFSEITLQNIGKQLSIVIDNAVVSAPNIKSHIATGQAYISGDMTLKQATQLRLILSSGALPAPLKVIEERTVGPSLGSDSIRSGQLSVMIAFALVAVFMVVVYALFGVFACTSLIFNIIFLFASLSILGATLTLPGIAGIALTIGMAVDANVLIYERIKEEIRSGLKPIQAIMVGFDRAMRAIVDSNLTTLIGAAVLYQFGSGPIRGFAVTLTLGILISMFTALTLTYAQIDLWSRRGRVQSLPLGFWFKRIQL